MAKIVLISCVSKKLSHKAKSEELYISPLFRMNLRYARLMKPDKIFILSAKYGLVSLNEELLPYNLTLKDMRSQEIKEWAEKVMQKLRIVSNLAEDTFIFLAGERYRKYLIPHIKNFHVPLQGLGIGKQLQFLKRSLQ